MKKILSVITAIFCSILVGCTTLSLKETTIGDYSPLSPIETVTNPNMVLIEGGTFMLGANATSNGVRTTVDSFYISKYEVTVGEFRRFINDTGYIPTGETYGYRVFASQNPGVPNKEAVNPSWDNPYMEQDENHPVVLVSWYDAIEYCNWLSIQEALTPAYKIIYDKSKATIEVNKNANGYRLPTEAEWEFALRAGSTTLYYYGDEPDSNSGWYVENSNKKTHPVGTKPPNIWGLYDMHGNVMEWVQDWYASNVKLTKGISFLLSVTYGKSDERFGTSNFAQGRNDTGFRIAHR